MAKKRKRRKRISSLFFRILTGITVPLIILLVAFTYLVVGHEMRRQDESSRRFGALTLQTIGSKLEQIFEERGTSYESADISREIRALQKTFILDTIDIIDPIRRLSLVTNTKINFDDMKTAHINEALRLKRRGRDYHTVIDTNQKKFWGYVPISDKKQNRMFVILIEYPLTSLDTALEETTHTLALMAVTVVAIALLIAFLLSLSIIQPIRKINRAFRAMLTGKLGLQIQVRTGDELEVLARNFNRMSQTISQLAHHAQDANPLTNLPGNDKIVEEMNSRLEKRIPFVFIHLDIDNFKAYNDRYGLSKGDEVLKVTGDILRKCTENAVQEGHFIGHQGGDDFCLILNADEAQEVSNNVCTEFDETIKHFYNEEDLERGYFVAEDARSDSMSGEKALKRYPLMSVSLAGVSNRNFHFKTVDDIMDFATHIKKEVKKVPYSKCIIKDEL